MPLPIIFGSVISLSLNEQFILRLATEADAPDIAAIYRPVVESTAISFETEAPSGQDMKERIRIVQDTHLWLVCEHRHHHHRDHHVIAYAYGSKHRERKAYQWATEVSVYVADGYRQKGVARALYTALLDGLKRQGYTLALAGITTPNPASEAFHHNMGFVPIATYERIGYKFGQWHDTVWMSRPLGEPSAVVPAPHAHSAITDSPEWKEILLKAGNMIDVKT